MFSRGLFDRALPEAGNGFQADSTALILSSYRHFTGLDLLEPSVTDAAQALYIAPFVVLAHEATDDPVFFYANRRAQTLFEMEWAELTCLPSRFSAEPLARDERQRLLERVTEHGFIDDYSGVRIAKSGRRFRIARATVWNLVDATGVCVGQAATFATWLPL